MPPEPEVDEGLSSEDFSDDDDNEYLLGFTEEAQPAALLRHRFPSKIGGRPAWLDPVNLPTAQQLSCGATGRQLNFLLQVYAPLDVEPPPPKPKSEPHGEDGEDDDGTRKDVFHRTLYLFVTPQGDKITSSKAVRAFRCQLPRSNPYYEYKPPGPGDLLPRPLVEDQAAQSKAKDPWGVLEVETAMRSAAPASSSGSSAAAQPVSGQPAPAGAAQPGQAATELAGLTLGSGGAQQSDSRVRSCTGGKDLLVLYPEKELMVEPEDREAEEENAAAQKLLAEYESRVDEEGELTEDELPAEILDQVEETHTLERKHFAMFQARMEAAPDQVIRYCFKPGARPLWPSPAHHPAPEDIPPCPHCKQPRVFEFQVMPQLLNSLDQDELSGASLDWSTLVVYSCATSCYAGVEAARQQGSAYVEEFVWVQPAA